jgi:hypothetical protein
MGKGMGFAAELQRRLTEQELIGVQANLNAGWDKKLEADREREEEQAATCHRGPGDPDYSGRQR